jgi:RNA recognition motif-containing protein
VGNIPKNFTEQTLRPLLESAGRVVELLIVRDKLSHESKGSAFVWYATKAEADWVSSEFVVQRCCVGFICRKQTLRLWQ